MVVLVLVFSSCIFGVEIYPRDSEDLPASPEDRRTLLSIVWSCLATIFACTWLSVHPNVPGRNITTNGAISCAIERVKIMATAILAPEVILAWAAEQFTVAWKLRHGEYFTSLGNESKLTLAHCFLLSMGGFYYTANMKSLIKHLKPMRLHLPRHHHHCSTHVCPIPPHLVKKLAAISAETIEDKNKGDAMSKAFSVLQISWFTMQCIARAIRHLPITLLETTALVFAGISFTTYCLWWNTSLTLETEYKEEPTSPVHCRWIERVRDGWHWVCNGIISTIIGEDFRPTTRLKTTEQLHRHNAGNPDIGRGAFRTSSGNDWGKPTKPTRFVILVGIGSLFGAFNCIAWSFYFPSHIEWCYGSFHLSQS
ncbi:hypothetical protein EDD85DRAFT_776737 [Armillaria nabsnona]|nr:hypothetical protein EDD85DRAFT_776737 [Armillaria nabsnona]